MKAYKFKLKVTNFQFPSVYCFRIENGQTWLVGIIDSIIVLYYYSIIDSAPPGPFRVSVFITQTFSNSFFHFTSKNKQKDLKIRKV